MRRSCSRRRRRRRRGARSWTIRAIRESACRIAPLRHPLDATHELLRAPLPPPERGRRPSDRRLATRWRTSPRLRAPRPGEARASRKPPRAGPRSMASWAPRSARRWPNPSACEARRERWSAPVRWLLANPPATTWRANRRGRGRADHALEQTTRWTDEANVLPLRTTGAPPSAAAAMLVFRPDARRATRASKLVRGCAKSRNWSLRQARRSRLRRPCAQSTIWFALASDVEPVVRLARRSRASAASRLKRGPSRRRARTLADPACVPTAGDDALALVADSTAGRGRAHSCSPNTPGPTTRLPRLGAIHVARQARYRELRPHLVGSPRTRSKRACSRTSPPLPRLRDVCRRGAGLRPVASRASRSTWRSSASWEEVERTELVG